MKRYIKNMGYFLLPLKVMDSDKQKHALFGSFLSIAYLILYNGFGVSKTVSIFATLLAVVVISYMIEIVQLFKPNRVFDNGDVAATLFGSIVAITFFLTLN